MLNIQELYEARQIAHMFDVQLRRELQMSLANATLLYKLKRGGRTGKELSEEFKVGRSTISRGLRLLRKKKLADWVWQEKLNKITPEGRKRIAAIHRRVKKLDWKQVDYVY